jgi:hypothetical protein
MPLGRRKIRQQFLDLVGQRRRRHRLRQNPEARAAFGLLLVDGLLDGAQKRAPGTDLAF